MTLEELVDSVKARFTVFYLEDPKVNSFLLQTLIFFESHAGHMIRLSGDEDSEGVFTKPSNIVGIPILTDDQHRKHRYIDDGTNITMTLDDFSVAPYTLTYFQALSQLGSNDVVPTEILQPIMNLLHSFLDKDNTVFERINSQAINLATDHLKSDDMLDTAITEAKADVKAQYAILPIHQLGI